MQCIANKQTDRVVRSFLEALDCPRALSVWLMYAYGEHDQLTKVEWDPLHYNSVSDAADSLAASKYLSKADFLRTSFDRKKVALNSYFDAEQRCALVNKKLLRDEIQPITRDAMLIASRKISLILGDVTHEMFLDDCDWGPGASTSIRRAKSNKPNKYVISRDITAEAYDFVSPFIAHLYLPWQVPMMCIVGGSKIVTVPKNSKTDRTIAIEPDFNIWFQKGIGATIRRKLRYSGIDLNDQGVNGERARLGSKFGHLATVDFSQASDSISLELVRQLLPRDWYSLLMAFRSKYSSLDGSYHYLHKISSMGNGFTFELESLIFYSLVLASCELCGVDHKGSSVYGDDVILPSSVVDVFTAICADLGLIVNKSKSYSSSYFRESCGTFWWNGVDIKPIYLREVIDDEKKIIKEANSIRYYAHRRLIGLGCDRRFRSCWTFLADLAGPKVPRVSFGFGDCGIITNRDDPLIQTVANPASSSGLEGTLIKCLIDRPRTQEIEHEGLLVYRLRTIGSIDRQEGNSIPFVNRTTRRLGRLRVPRWYDLGYWL